MHNGMTLKQFHRSRFFALIEEYSQALAHKDTTKLIRVSVELHATKCHVTKALWPLASFKRLTSVESSTL